MRPYGAEDGASETRCFELTEQGLSLPPDATLELAFAMFENSKLDIIPIVAPSEDESAPPDLLGALFYIDALKAYNRALAEIAREEHA